MHSSRLRLLRTCSVRQSCNRIYHCGSRHCTNPPAPQPPSPEIVLKYTLFTFSVLFIFSALMFLFPILLL